MVVGLLGEREKMAVRSMKVRGAIRTRYALVSCNFTIF